MSRTALVLLATLTTVTPTLTAATQAAVPSGTQLVAADARVLTAARVERNGKDILMTEGQQRVMSVPWSGVKVYQDNGGRVTVSLTNQTAAEVSPSASPRTSATSPSTPIGVRTAQRDLKDDGYYSGPVDGVIGPRTETALRHYQRKHGLKVTGRLDSRTVHSLSAAAEASPPASPSSAIDLRTAQQKLEARGYYSGPVDGVAGPNTEAALRHYQRDHGLRVTSELDSPTSRSLRSESTAAR